MDLRRCEGGDVDQRLRSGSSRPRPLLEIPRDDLPLSDLQCTSHVLSKLAESPLLNCLGSDGCTRKCIGRHRPRALPATLGHPPRQPHHHRPRHSRCAWISRNIVLQLVFPLLRPRPTPPHPHPHPQRHRHLVFRHLPRPLPTRRHSQKPTSTRRPQDCTSYSPYRRQSSSTHTILHDTPSSSYTVSTASHTAPSSRSSPPHQLSPPHLRRVNQASGLASHSYIIGAKS